MSRNADLPKLLRAVAGGSNAKESRQDIIFTAAADEIEGLRGLAAEMLAVLLSAREQLEDYEYDRTGESFNNVKLNATIQKATAALPSPEGRGQS